MNGVIVPPELANADASKEETAIGIGDVEGLATPFGHAMLQNFNFAPGYINLNHGSYGSMPKPVLRATEALALEAEARPDKFMRMTYLPLLTRVRTRVAQLINANADECVMVTNTSHGINTVLRNFPWKEGDIIIGFSTTYGAVSRTLKYLSDVAPNPTLSTIELTFPTSHASILERTRAHIRSLSRSEGQDVVMVLDGIISNPGARMPWEEIVAICKEEHVWSVVDAAHCIGQIDIDLEAVQPDFWVSNCHKWLLSKRGSAVLYVPKRNQHIIKSTFPTSIGYKSLEDTNFVGQFDWTGTSDFVPVLSVNAALDFRASIGGEKKINEYCHSLAVKGGKRLAEILGTRTLDETGEFTANMTDVLLPLNISPNATDAELWAILWKFYDKMLAANFFAAIYVHDRKWWTRCSAQIWIELSDFEFVGHALARICAELKEEGS
ncbi:hypothetical protein BOTBODRAFT_108045 [Botryobasidium botryosum FD-172 SS1]|uniref:Aminotransferase class V domain-containing protein n=1 Tax=Botryobasidium botryosum (strain FD-172 SS1) TaxID=930990 RepID=A0A067MJT6_BOTB1|nr:hypothetical protein BOTBODRAFT_108045 [Botryobasidium botryosum FD-172 SS1]